jgi:hypothetical protein
MRVDTGAQGSSNVEAPDRGKSGATLADRGRRLFEFLAQTQMLKATPHSLPMRTCAMAPCCGWVTCLNIWRSGPLIVSASQSPNSPY